MTSNFRGALLVAGVAAGACRPPSSAEAPPQPSPRPPTTEEPSTTAAAPMFTTAALDVQHPGCFALLDLSTNLIEHGGEQPCDERTSPASTFKVPHALIALDTGVITDPDAMLTWDGTEYPHMKAWQRDHSLRSAIYHSVVWVFQHTAREIGRTRMREYLTAFEYGNANVEGPIDMFWLREQALRVNPIETTQFWAKLFRDELPRGGESAARLRPLLVRPPSSFEGRVADDFTIPPMSPDATMSAKTGTGYYGEGSVTWLAGHIDCPEADYVFVSRVTAETKPSAISPAVRHGLAVLDRRGILGCSASSTPR